MKSQLFSFRFAAAVAVAAALASCAFGQDFWGPTSGGTYNWWDSANWSTNAVPGPSDSAVFQTAGLPTVTVDFASGGSDTVSNLYVLNENALTFDLGSNMLTISNDWQVGALETDGVTNGNAAMTVQNGTISGNTLEVGLGTGNAGVLNVGNGIAGGNVALTGMTDVGNSGTGTLNVLQSSSFSTGSLAVGSQGTVSVDGGTLSVGGNADFGNQNSFNSGTTLALGTDGTAGTMNVGGTLTLGATEDATANIDNGSTLTVGSLQLDPNTLAQSSQMVVDNSTITAGSISVGNGSLTEQNGATVNTDSLGAAGENGRMYVNSGSTLNVDANAENNTQPTVAMDGMLLQVDGGNLNVGDASHLATFDNNGSVYLENNATMTVYGNVAPTGYGEWYESNSSAATINGNFTSASYLTLDPTSSLAVTGSVTLGGNGLNSNAQLGGGMLSAGNGVTVESGSSLIGPGTVIGNVDNFGDLNIGPLDSVSSMTINGNYTQESAGSMDVTIDGATSGNYSTLAVSGAANFGGVLNLFFGYSPAAGDSYTLATYGSEAGQFAAISGATIPVGFGLTYNATTLVGQMLNASAFDSWQQASGGPYNWTDGTNWASGTPTSGDVAVFDQPSSGQAIEFGSNNESVYGVYMPNGSYYFNLGTGSLNVTQKMSVGDQSANLGGSGTATLLITGQGAGAGQGELTGGDLAVGSVYSSAGTVTVDGTGGGTSVDLLGTAYVGILGSGTLNVLNGATFNANNINVGSTYGSGIVQVSGTGSTLSATNSIDVGLGSGFGTSLTVDTGGLVTAPNVNIDEYGTGTFNGPATLDGTTSVLASGTLNLNGGSVLNTPSFTASGTVTADGTNGSTTINAENTVIGGTTGYGFSDLTLQNGATMNGLTVIGSASGLGYGANLNVDSGSTLNLTNTGSSALNVSDLSVVAQNGTINVGTLSNPGTINVGGVSPLGFSSNSISATGSVMNLQGNAIVGSQGSTGSVYLQSSSSWNISGSLTIDNGENADVGSVTVDSSTLNVGGATTVGDTNANPAFSDSGFLKITNGGSMTATGGITVNPDGTLMGNGLVSGNVTNNGGTVNVGDGPGTFSLMGNYSQNSAGTLIEQVAGSTAGATNGYSVFNISGTATISGALNFQLENGFTPYGGELFNFLTASGGLTGTFSSITSGFSVDYGPNGVTIMANPTPEPAALLGLGVGLFALVFRRRKSA